MKLCKYVKKLLIERFKNDFFKVITIFLSRIIFLTCLMSNLLVFHISRLVKAILLFSKRFLPLQE